MPASLLQTQFDDLEERQPDEAGMTVDVAKTPEQIVDELVSTLTESTLTESTTSQQRPDA
jgi:gluconokinase